MTTCLHTEVAVFRHAGMTNTELILNMLAEASAKEISEAVNPDTFEESKQ